MYFRAFLSFNLVLKQSFRVTTKYPKQGVIMEWRPLPGYTFMVVGPCVVMFNLSLPLSLGSYPNWLSTCLEYHHTYITTECYGMYFVQKDGFFFILSWLQKITVPYLYSIGSKGTSIHFAFQDCNTGCVHKTLLKVTFTFYWFMFLPQLTGKLVIGFYFSCPQRNYLPALLLVITGIIWKPIVKYSYTRGAVWTTYNVVSIFQITPITYSPLQQHTLD